MTNQDDRKRARIIELIDSLAEQARALEILDATIDKHRNGTDDTWPSTTAELAAQALTEQIERTLLHVDRDMWEKDLETAIREVPGVVYPAGADAEGSGDPARA